MNGVADGLSLGELVRAARGRRRWTQQQLADRLEVNRKTVDNWENGRTTPPLATVAAIEHVLGINLSDGEPDAIKPRDEFEAELLSLKHLPEGEAERLIRMRRAQDERPSRAS